jgi:predicted kinase
MINMPKLLILRGIPCSGKSRLAKQIVAEGKGKWKRVNKDDLRAMVDEKWTPEKEKFIVNCRDTFISCAISNGFNVICDDTNLKEEHVEQMIRVGKQSNEDLEIEVRWCPISLNEAIKRDSRREVSVGEKVIRNMYEQYVKVGGPVVTSKEVYEQRKDLPKCIICDLDGTLAKMDGRGPHEQWKCNKDKVNESVLLIINSLWIKYPIILFSGRFEQYRPQTIEFLDEYNIPHDGLYMRKDDDYRKDSIVKEEMFFEHVDGQYKVEFVMEDRDQCVRLWRDLGLSCFQVNWGKF